MLILNNKHKLDLLISQCVATNLWHWINVQPYGALEFEDYFNIHLGWETYSLVGNCYLIMFDIYELTTC